MISPDNKKYITEEKPILVATYGTLLRGEGNHGRMIDARGQFVGSGITKNNANIYRYCGGFPSVSLAHTSNETPVNVEVYRVDNLGLVGPLDGLEGTRYPPHHDSNFYNRTEVDIVLENGDTVTAWVYHIDEDLGDQKLITTGNWLTRGGLNN